jgi:hypothetical protein
MLNQFIHVGIRNFVVGVNVKVASDEVAMRKEKTYINKLNLALVQVYPSVFVNPSQLTSCVSDPEARVAAQLADVHHRTCRVIQN